jgi:hypothetical protein
MKTWGRFLLAMLIASSAVIATAAPALAQEELVVQPCSELIRLAANYEEDLKTVDIVLGAAIEAGDMDKIKIYKLRKAAVKKQLTAILKAIDIKDCVKP